jgi:hypothetical protein
MALLYLYIQNVLKVLENFIKLAIHRFVMESDFILCVCVCMCMCVVCVCHIVVTAGDSLH